MPYRAASARFAPDSDAAPGLTGPGLTGPGLCAQLGCGERPVLPIERNESNGAGDAFKLAARSFLKRFAQATQETRIAGGHTRRVRPAGTLQWRPACDSVRTAHVRKPLGAAE